MADAPTAKQIASALRQVIFELGLKSPKQDAVLQAAIDHIEASAGLAVSWLPPGDHFVMVAERDSQNETRYTWDAFGVPRLDCEIHQPLGPITWEHYLGEHTTRDQITKRSEQFGDNYGRKAIAKLVFVRADL